MDEKHVLTLFAAAILAIPTASATVNSADVVEYQSEGSQFFDGPVILLSTTSNYDTNRFHFQLDNNDYDQMGIDGEVQDQVTVEVTNQETEAVYTLRDTGLQPIYRFEPLQDRLKVGEFASNDQILNTIENSDMRNTCYDISGDGTFNGEDYYARTVWTWTGRHVDVYCLKTGEQLGTVGEITSSPRDVFQTEWEARNDNGLIERATISNGDMGPSVTRQLGPNIKVMFSGAASTGRNSPVPTDELILHNNRAGFRIIQRGDYQTYTSNVDDLLSNLERWGRGTLQRENVALSINANAVEASKEHTSSEFLPGSDPDGDGQSEVAGYSFDGSSIQSGELRLQIDELLYPEFQVAVRACRHQPGDTCNAFVRIERTVGAPQITASSGAEFSELQTGEVSVTYQNIGNSDGSFESTVTECGGQFTFSGLSDRASLGPGESTTASFPISFSTTETSQDTFSNSCTLQVKETTTGETVSTTVNVEASQQQECTPGERFRKAEVVQQNGENVKQYTVYECNQQGTAANEVKTCDPGELAEPQSDGTYRCVSDSGGNGGSGGDSDGCEPIVLISNPVGNDITLPNILCQISNAVSGAWGAVTTAAALFAFLVGYGLRVPAMKIAKIHGAIRILDYKIKLGWIIGILFGLILAYGTFTFLSNPVIKWGFIILGTVGTAVYLYLFGPGSFVKAMLPIG